MAEKPDRVREERVVTDDGSITFHSAEYDENYHSTSGALTEADKKYAEVCGIQDMEEVDVLDICFGLGYNSAAAIDRFRGKRINIVGLEQNEGIVEEIVRMGKLYPFKCRDVMIEVAKNKFYSNRADSDALAHDEQTAADSPTAMIPAEESKSSLGVAASTSGGAAIDVKLIMGDARETIKELPSSAFDCVFLDPFSPKKCPELWTKEFFQEIYRVMRHGGKVATYSCARMVRDNMFAAGFRVSDGPCVGRRAPGTVGIKE